MYSPYIYKTAGGLTRGQTIWNNGFVPSPDDMEPMSAELTASLLQRAFETMYYIGNGGVSDVYINGTNPNVAGYTPTTPIIIIGPQGMQVETFQSDAAEVDNLDLGNLEWRIDSTVDGLQPMPFDTIPDVNDALPDGRTIDAQEYFCAAPTIASRTTILGTPITPPPGGYVWRIRLWQNKVSTGHTRDISRIIAGPAAETIVTFPDDTFAWADFSFYGGLGGWRLTASSGATVVNP